MNTVKKLSGVALVSAAATLLLAGCGGDSTKTAAKAESAPAETAKVAEVKCSGINSCKGTGACASATHACAGQNSCKGQGWVKASKADCEAKGGKIITS
jgi:outer membrane biogenesis lipoprotein LolB